MARLEKTMHYRRPKYGGYKAALLSSSLMGIALFLIVAKTGDAGKELILLQSLWSNFVPSAAVSEGAEEMLSISEADPDAELLEALQNLDGPEGEIVVEDPSQWQVVRMKVTAYCPCKICCGRHADGITACNHRIRPGDRFIAADKFYRFGTEMIIPGYNQNQAVEVKDRGRLIKGNRLDVFFSSHRTAMKWGVKYLDVLVKTE